MSLSEPPANAIIYPEAGVGTLIGRAWNLVRLNIRPTLLLMMIPTILYTVVSVLFSIPSGINTLITAPSGHLLAVLLSVGGGLLLSLVAWFVALACACMLCRIFYSSILQPSPEPLQASRKFILARLPRLSVLFLGVFILYIFFIIVDVLIGIFGFSVGIALMGRLSMSLGGNVPGMLVIIFTLLAWGAVIASILIGLGSVQMLFCSFPLVAAATAKESVGIRQSMAQSWRLLWHNLPKGMLFAALLLFFHLLLAVIFNLLPAVWSYIEMKRLGLDPQMRVQMPLHVSTVVNIWSNLMNMILVPFFLSSMTMFWYDCQVRREGLDLFLWLGRLKAREPGGAKNRAASDPITG